MPGTSDNGYASNYYTSSQYPTWAEDLGYQQGNAVGGMMNRVGDMTNNWYQGPLVAGQSGLQQYASSQAWNPYQWQDALGGAANAYRAAAAPYSSSTLQQYLDPYAGDVVSNMGRLSQEKLRSDLDDVNSTFTGSGQFGSTRNRRFVEDALQRSQREYQGAVGGVMSNAYNTANQNYYNWSGRPMQVASGLQALASTGSNLGWNDINNQFGLGAKEQATNQAGMDASYKDWQNQYALPASMLAQIGQLGNQTIGAFKPNTTQTGQTVTPQINGAQQVAGGLTTLDKLLRELGVYG